MNKFRLKDQGTQLYQVTPLIQTIPISARNTTLVRLVANTYCWIALVIDLRVRGVQQRAGWNLK